MKYIFERNPDTGDIFRREFGKYDKREKINNPTATNAKTIANICTLIITVYLIYYLNYMKIL